MAVVPPSVRWLVLVASFLAACGGGGGGGSGSGGGNGGGTTVDLERSSFEVAPAFGTPADGVTPVELVVQLVSDRGEPIAGATLAFEVDGLGNTLGTVAPTDAAGRTRATLASSASQRKRVTATATVGARRTALGTRTAEFLEIPEGTFFVRTSGSDADDGRSPLSAWRTLEHAFAELPAGATLFIGAGLHSAPLALTLVAPTGAPTLVAGDRDGHWTGDAGPVRIDGGGGAVALALSGTRNLILSGLELSGAEVGLLAENVEALLVRDCSLSANGLGAAVHDGREVSVEDCRIHANRGAGLELARVERVRVQNNLIYANGASGLDFPGTAVDTLVRFNTFHGNGGDHVHAEVGGSSGALEENIFSAGLAGAFGLANGSSFVALRNLSWGHAAVGEEPIVADPAFTSPEGVDGAIGGDGAEDDDFTLAAGSPALDAASLEARAVRLGGRAFLAARSSRADRLADGSAPDGAAANLGFHGPLAPTEFVTLAPGATRLVLADPAVPAPLALALAADGLTTSRGAPLGHQARWSLARVSPLTSPEEFHAVLLDTGEEGVLSVRRHDGRGWDDPALAPLVVGLARETLVDRGFDLEHEARSGRALFAWSNASGAPRFQLHTRGRWTLVREVPLPSGPFAAVRWVELVPRARTNELALFLLDEAGRLACTLWDGQAFGPARLVARDVLYRPGWRPFDAAYEGTSGDLLVAWGFDVFTESLRWAERAQATGAWREGLFSSADSVSADVELAGDLASDRIAAVFGEADLNDDVAVAVWDGADWTDSAELTLAGGTANRLRAVTWLGAGGNALAVYPAPQGSLRAALYDGGNWRLQPEVVLPGVGRPVRLELVASGPGEARGALLDQEGRLFAVGYSSGRFVLLDEAPLATGLDSHAAFDLTGR